MTKAELKAIEDAKKAQALNEKLNDPTVETTAVEGQSSEDSDLNNTRRVSIRNVRIRKEYTAFTQHPKGHKGKKAMPARPNLINGELENDLEMEGWIGDDIRVLFTFFYGTFPFPINRSYELFLDGEYEVEDIIELEKGQELVRKNAPNIEMTDVSMQGARQLWIGGYAQFKQ